MKPLDQTYDVVIIGGGPAGSSMGSYLAREGVRTLILEKEHFPRPHVGESLLPFCYEIFEDLGVLKELEATMVRKPGVRFYNADGSDATTYCFRNLLDGPNYLSFHVLRERFDKILLDRASALNATVAEGCAVTHVNLENEKPIIHFSHMGEIKEVVCDFVVDATGQDTFLASRLKVKHKRQDLDRIGLLCHWKDYNSNDGIEEGLLQLVYTSGEKKGWWAIIPVDHNRLSVTFVVDFAYVRAQKKRLEKSDDWKLAFYLEEMINTPVPHSILKDAKRIQDLLVVGNYSYSVDKRYGSNFAMIGDAAGFIDPIFATGVYLALNSSRIVAPAIVEKIKGNPHSAQEAMNKAYANFNGAVTLVEKFIRNFYDPNFINLAEVQNQLRTKDASHSRHEIAFSILHFLMGGDLFNEYERYSEFIDFLKEPKQLERYMHLVINQEGHQDTRCSSFINEIYPKVV